jgi:hypothetical protein
VYEKIKNLQPPANTTTTPYNNSYEKGHLEYTLDPKTIKNAKQKIKNLKINNTTKFNSTFKNLIHYRNVLRIPEADNAIRLLYASQIRKAIKSLKNPRATNNTRVKPLEYIKKHRQYLSKNLSEFPDERNKEIIRSGVYVPYGGRAAENSTEPEPEPKPKPEPPKPRKPRKPPKPPPKTQVGNVETVVTLNTPTNAQLKKIKEEVNNIIRQLKLTTTNNNTRKKLKNRFNNLKIRKLISNENVNIYLPLINRSGGTPVEVNARVPSIRPGARQQVINKLKANQKAAKAAKAAKNAEAAKAARNKEAAEAARNKEAAKAARNKEAARIKNIGIAKRRQANQKRREIGIARRAAATGKKNKLK